MNKTNLDWISRSGLRGAAALAAMLLANVMLLAQRPLKLSEILDSILLHNPVVRMYDADIRSMDEAAKGAKSWMAPELGAGLFMTPYDLQRWKKVSDMEPGMGSFMVSLQQMFPNRGKLNADALYMQSMSGATKEEKKAALSDLYAQAKKLYLDWIIIEKKKAVLEENEKILEFMIQNAEIRYKHGLEKINAYYKAKAALGDIERMKVMFENEKIQKRIALNTLMFRQDTVSLAIDSSYMVKDYSNYALDTTNLAAIRSDVRSIDRQILTNRLRLEAERFNLKPQLGIRFDHMIGFGAQPQQFTLMGMVRLPFVSWASRMTKANIESYKWRTEALISQRQMLLNEVIGMATGIKAEMDAKKRQVRLYEVNIIPALRNNYKTILLAYEQNTEELFMLFDAWETLNMAQNEYLDQLSELLNLQVEFERIIEIRD